MAKGLSDKILIKRLIAAEKEHLSLYRKKKTKKQINRQWEVKRKLNAYYAETDRRGLIQYISDVCH